MARRNRSRNHNARSAMRDARPEGEPSSWRAARNAGLSVTAPPAKVGGFSGLAPLPRRPEAIAFAPKTDTQTILREPGMLGSQPAIVSLVTVRAVRRRRRWRFQPPAAVSVARHALLGKCCVQRIACSAFCLLPEGMRLSARKSDNRDYSPPDLISCSRVDFFSRCFPCPCAAEFDDGLLISCSPSSRRPQA
jgi:hypothetical protein